jgi:hypothetical protein
MRSVLRILVPVNELAIALSPTDELTGMNFEIWLSEIVGT